jgi:hypothetical protein
MTMHGFHLGNPDSEFVEVRLHSIADVAQGEDWLGGDVSVSAGSFRAGFRGAFQSHDFQKFAAELRSLWQTLAGRATFVTREGQLELKVSGNGRGGIAVLGEACEHDPHNRLTFELTLDQTYLEPVLRELEALLATIGSTKTPG